MCSFKACPQASVEIESESVEIESESVEIEMRNIQNSSYGGVERG